MVDQKLDNLLNLSLAASKEERQKSGNLNVGYDESTNKWDVIVKYSGSNFEITGENVQVVPLLGGYAVVTLSETELSDLTANPQIEFIEIPKRLYFALYEAKAASCVLSVQRRDSLSDREGLNLTGQGVLVGIVDSGIDYRHPDFRNEDGSSRILGLWDQSASGNGIGAPPEGYVIGAEYTAEMINEALRQPVEDGYQIIPERDLSGHGTAVAGILAGNGRESNGRYRGLAYESDLFVVKLAQPRDNSFPRTTELLQGIDYLARQAIRLGRPMVINLSFGNSYGSHEPYN